MISCKGKSREASTAQPDPKLDGYITAFTSKLGSLGKIKSTLATTPALTKDDLPTLEKGRFTLIAAEQLDLLGNCFSNAKVCDNDWWLLSHCDGYAKLSREKLADDPTAPFVLKNCAELHYLVVARQTAFKAPVLAMETKTYEHGTLSADLFVFDIDTAKYLGGFKASSSTPDKLEGMERNSGRIETWLLELIGIGLNQATEKKFGFQK